VILVLHNRQQVIEVIKTNSQAIKLYAIESIGIFGSFSRNEAKSHSDVDIIVTFREGSKTFRNFMGLKVFLQDLLRREVDMVSSDNIRDELKPYIMKEIIYVEGLGISNDAAIPHPPIEDECLLSALR
jgi:uncharacterized protein